MFITKKHIQRRTFLRGAGVALGLPLLDAMIPASTALAQTAATPPPRFFAGFVPHGAAPGYWVPEVEGALPAELPFIWKDLEPFRNTLNILTGLHATSSEPPPGETGADHWVAAAFLCAEKPRRPPVPMFMLARRSTRSLPKRSAGNPCCHRSKCRLRTRVQGQATAVKATVVSTPTRSRGRRRRRHCRWS